MGGENGGCTRAGVTTSGSSPRGRGKRNQPRRAHPAGRLIPARAGKTSHGPDHRLASTAHPRAGGENDHENILTIPQKGSSPRGRGKRYPRSARPVRDGLIPARAGKTGRQGRPAHRRPAHPRAGGENPVQRYGFSLRYGSSPRGRGKPLIAVAENHSSRLIPARAGKQNPSSGAHHLRGLIPARAGKTTRLRRCPTKRSAHPRAGGENVALAEGVGPAMGSSPRGRGKPRTHGAHARADGLIPARAGKTKNARRPCQGRWAHPRAGGENSGDWWTIPIGRVSSPRGRGKRAPTKPPPRPTRLIPARAGKTLRCISPPRTSAAHPRAGGENIIRQSRAGTLYGSSPRGRGKPPLPAPSHPICGLIPARAGKTPAPRRWVRADPAHPRAGGENPIFEATVSTIDGSSPRGRGKHCEPVECSVIAGLIPARAGKTASMPLDSTVIGAHPRAGGENSRSSRTFVSWLGSSPRGRGKHQVWRCYEEHSRLIPARAGKTSLHDTSCAMYRAHPRAGGENLSARKCCSSAVGSSPRGRGKQGLHGGEHRGARLIPARAGKTGSREKPA